ncbi:MAG: translation initiation factor IF-2 [Candidatus Saccharimonadales bacterium]|jgi:translation initiation factor IF-2
MAVATIEIDATITVGDLAEKLSVPVTNLIGELFKNGMMITVNEKVDFDTAQIIVGELGLEIELVRKSAEDAVVVKREKSSVDPNAKDRPPVIAVMGHVDHGKTSLLDKIRGGKVAAGESGGITQHISAYQIDHKTKSDSKDTRKITFLDTPGHEAFAALREHGALLTDLVVIVVAADDGIKPQTLEAIRFARKAGVKMIVAANKMDKEGADVNKLKQQLSENEMMPEDWGGDTIIMPVSAMTGEGIPELIDMILLLADVEELKALDTGPARGLVIESHLEQGRGPIAVSLIEHGKLSKGDYLVAGSAYGKARTIHDTDGNEIKSAGPSTPVLISGFKSMPDFGDIIEVAKTEKEARRRAEIGAAEKSKLGKTSHVSDSELLRIITQKNQLQELNVFIKADVQGSLTSVIDSLKTLGTEEVAVRIVGSGVGAVTDSDIHMAATSNAILYGFHVVMPPALMQLASRDKVSVRKYEVIYELLDDAKEELSELLAPEVIEHDLGRIKVKKVFKTTQKEIIAGGEVTIGTVSAPAKVKITRDKEVIAEIEASRLQRGPQEVKEVQKGEECGVTLQTGTRINLQEGDNLEFFTRELIERTL